MSKEREFWNALRDLFVGAEIEGESGYINLMRIKSRYYTEGVFPKLKEDIDEALRPFPEFREELFEKLYDFFSRYFSESGSIYFSHTPAHKDIYEKIYTDARDVILFWKTHMLYYVKTDRLFRSMEVEVDGYKFYFDVSKLEHKKNNEKRGLVYEFKEKRKDGVFVFTAQYSERGRKTNVYAIRKEIKKYTKKVPPSETLERAFRIFERQSEVDYFINKNAKAFLKEQFDLWMYQYVFKGESQWSERRIKQLQVLRDIAYKVIDFISQFEDELVKIWNKPKFVLNSNYVITLDRLAKKEGGIEVIEKILSHGRIEEQIKEWEELGIVDKGFRKEDVLVEDLSGKRLNERYRFLPIDTKYFKDLELEILGLFDDLDKELDGWLIKSENYQALNTILPKFKERVQTIYIDPPYNTGSDEFLYKDNYRHSSWLTMMENRLKLAKELMKEEGVIFISIDDNELERLKLLLVNYIFDENKFLETFLWNNTSTPPSLSSISRKNVEYILTFVKNNFPHKFKGRPAKGNDAPLLNRGNPIRVLEFPPQSVTFKIPDGIYKKGERKRVKLLDDVIVENQKNKNSFRIECESKWTQETLLEEIKSGTTFIVKSNDFSIRYLRTETEGWITPDKYIDNVFLDKKAGVGTNEDSRKEIENLGLIFDAYPKPSSLIHYLIRMTTDKAGYVLDFFAGSGTTAHAVMKLNKEDDGKRKFILIEMADYFYTVIIPRIKKVAYSFNWKEGRPQDTNGIGIFFKYYELEQYEDTLRKAKYEDADLFENPYSDPYNQYVFLRDLKMLEALEVDTEKDSVKVDLSKLYKNIDIAETLSNLTGKWIKRIGKGYVEFEDGERVDTENLDWRRIKPLIWW